MIPNIRELFATVTLLGGAAAAVPAPVHPPAPAWLSDLVVYEIATKAFTSPNGPQTGNFESLRASLPYLQDLGITGIWLSGHSLADPTHFYNIWTQYAVVEPDKIDPSLGTPEQFKALIDEAHRRGIKIFLDVITHGVMPGSSLIERHPQWFKGGSWGMVDYDWQGGHKDLDDWWVDLWTRHVTHYGVDGFRLDVDVYRPDLWARIRQNAAAAGHPIVIFAENEVVIPGVTDFYQKDNRLHGQASGELNSTMVNDIPKFYREKFGREGEYKVSIDYFDGSEAHGSTNAPGTLQVHSEGLTSDKASREWRNLVKADGIRDLKLTVSGVAQRPVRKVTVTREPQPADAGLTETWSVALAESQNPYSFISFLTVEGHPSVLELYVPTLSHGSSIQLSSHDNGWTGFPEDKNPYTAQGSRSLMGYSFLFTPMIPIFMSGEEFDAGFQPLPGLSPDLFGGKRPGKGRWLYGAMLDWTELDRPRHRAMLEDVKRMLAIRKRERAVLTPEVRGDIEPRLMAIPYSSDIEVPAPYMRWNGSTAIVVAANRNREKDANLGLKVPIEKLGEAANGMFKVTDLWNGGRTKTYSARQLMVLDLRIKRDGTSRGGLAVLKVEAL